MFTIELLLPLLFIIFLTIYLTFKDLRKITLLVGGIALFVTLLIHFLLRPFMWMIYPLYIALVLIALIANLNSKLKKNQSNLVWGSILTLSLISFILTALFPLREIPKPTGNLLVGSFSWDIQTNRLELYSDQAESTRSIRVQAWYPASAPTKKVKWLGDGAFTSQGLAIDFGFPGFIFDHLQNVKSNSYLNAPILDGLYPLVIVSHGWSGFRQLHTDLVEDLASNGFIVIGIEHTYGSVGTVFEDGTKVSLNPQALPPRSKTPDFLDYANKLVNTYAGDITSVLDEIESYKNNDLKTTLFNSIDFSSVTLIGHSTGGGAAVKVGITDDRVQAVIGLDAWVEPLKQEELLTGLNIPSLLIRSEGWYISYNNNYLKTLIESSPKKPIAFQMNGTTHYDFGMVYMFTTLAPFIGLQGERGMQMPLDQNKLVREYLFNLLSTPETPFNWQNIPDVEALVFP